MHSDGTERAMARVARCEQASEQWTALADRAPAGSLREKVCRNLARTAWDDANRTYLQLLSPRRSRWDSVALPVRVVDR